MIAPTKIYVKALKMVKEAGVRIKGCSHITGGGFYENVPRMLPEGVCAVIKKDSYQVPPIFKLLAKEGKIADEMMLQYLQYGYRYGTGSGCGGCGKKTMEAIKASGEIPYVLGEAKAGEKGVTLC